MFLPIDNQIDHAEFNVLTVKTNILINVLHAKKEDGLM